MQSSVLQGDGQPQPGTACRAGPRGVGTPEPIEHQARFAWTKSNPVVADHDSHRPVIGPDPDLDRLALAVFNRVDDKVAQDSLHPAGIAGHLAGHAGVAHGDPAALAFGKLLTPIDHLGHRAAQVGRLSVPEATGPLRSAADVGFGTEPPPLPRRAVLRLGDRLTWVDIARLDAPDGLVSTPGPKGTATTSASPSGPITPSGPTTPSSPNVSTTGSVASSTAASVEDLPSVPAAYVGLAVSALGGDLAAVSEGGTELARWHEGNRVTVEPSGTALVRPSYDGQGRLWVAGRSGRASRVWTLDSRSPVDSAEPVVAEWLSARSILALAVSRDGSRVAVVSSLPDGTDRRLDVAGVVRTTSGRPTSLAKPYRQGEPLDRLSEVVWIDDTTMAALGAVRAGDPLRPWLVQLGEGIGLRRIGIADPTTNFLPVPATARFLGSAGGPRGLLVMGEPTGVLVRVGGSWRALEGASEIAVPPLG